MKKTMVILDNGHGNDTAGKRSPVWSDGKQLMEYEFNRDVVNMIHSSLTSLGIESVILIPEISDISLNERCRRANVIYTKLKQTHNVFLVSVHANAGGGLGVGWECFTSKGETQSDKLAESLYNSAISFWKNKKMRMDALDGDKDKEENFYILKNTLCPAVLTENFFYDNEAECRYLMSKEGRKEVAKVHVDGITSYISTL